MSLSGLGAVCIWHDLVPEATEDFQQWHAREHMPERVGIPGFRRGRRYIAVDGASPLYFNLYEADSAEVLGGQDYLNRLNAPTPWTRRVVPSFRNVARAVCRVQYTAGVGQGGLVLTRRFDVEGDAQDEAIAALRQRVLPPLVDRPGIAGVHLCVADDAVSNIATAERKARADATEVPSFVLLIEGLSEAALASADAALLDAWGTLRGASAPGAGKVATYRLEHVRCKTPWAAG